MVTLQETLQGTLNAAFLGLVEAAPVQLQGFSGRNVDSQRKLLGYAFARRKLQVHLALQSRKMLLSSKAWIPIWSHFADSANRASKP